MLAIVDCIWNLVDSSQDSPPHDLDGPNPGWCFILALWGGFLLWSLLLKISLMLFIMSLIVSAKVWIFSELFNFWSCCYINGYWFTKESVPSSFLMLSWSRFMCSKSLNSIIVCISKAFYNDFPAGLTSLLFSSPFVSWSSWAKGYSFSDTVSLASSFSFSY